MIDSPNIGAVAIGSDFQTLGVVRSLRERNVPVFLVEHEHGIARYSRHVRRRTQKRDLFTSSDGAQFLVDLAKRERLEGWVLFVNSDDAVKFLSKNVDLLSTTFRVPVPAWETTYKFFDKSAAYRIAESIDVPIPRMFTASNIDELLAQDLVFPLVLKPTVKENYYEKTHKKAILVENREQLIAEFGEMVSIIPASQIVVQELICGGPRNLYSFATVFDGERSVAGMSALRSRQHPMDFGHATTFAESVHVPQIEELAVSFLRAIGYRGIAEVEFMFDERTQSFKFIEMNGRVWGWHTLAKSAGVNLPYALFELMTDRAIQPVTPEIGVKWVRMVTDAPTVLGELLRRRMTMGEYVRSLRGQVEDAVFCWSDPLPFFMEVAFIPYLWWKKGF